MEDASRTPSFLIDSDLWEKFNLELRAACHWCTHHHTTTPAEAAKQLERGEGWPRDWISRKVKNSTRQFGGLFICPAPDCAGHSNSKGERKRRWFCRFCINRHLGVDLKSFFQFDEVKGKWIQVPNLICWHCLAKVGDAVCVNCPQKHTQRAKRPKESLPPTRALLSSPGIAGVGAGAIVLLPSAEDCDYDGVSSEGRGGPTTEVHSIDESNFTVGDTRVRLGLPLHVSPVSDLRFVGVGDKEQRRSEHQHQHQHQHQQPAPNSFVSQKAGGPPVFKLCNSFCKDLAISKSSNEFDVVAATQLRHAGNSLGRLCHEPQVSIVPRLLEFVNNSCTPFHATAEARRHLLGAGFQQLSECEEWALQPGGRYFFTRNMSSIFAFAIGRKYKPGNGFHVVAAHTDSPCPKLKPVSHSSKGSFLHIQVQTYGPGLWHTWFDRDLSVAGRVLLRRKDGELVHELVRVRRPILRIPSLPKVPERDLATEGGKGEMDAQFAPVLAIQIESELTVSCDSESSMPAEHPEQIDQGYSQNRTAHHPLLISVLAEELKCDVTEVADFELSVYDMQPSCVGGMRDEFVFAGRLDNLASSFCALSALLDTCTEPSSLMDESCIRMVALFDIGEVQSDTAQGAGPQTMLQAMTRITRWLARGTESEGVVERALRRSFIVAADMAHAMHPTQVCGMGEDDAFHHPKLFEGLVIKQDALHSNATDIVTSFLFREVAKRNCIPVQGSAVTRDMGCCSTVNPILAAGYGIRIVDCGLPQLSMHSVREMCGAEDINTAFRHFRAFFHEFTSIDEQLKVDM